MMSELPSVFFSLPFSKLGFSCSWEWTQLFPRTGNPEDEILIFFWPIGNDVFLMQSVRDIVDTHSLFSPPDAARLNWNKEVAQNEWNKILHSRSVLINFIYLKQIDQIPTKSVHWRSSLKIWHSIYSILIFLIWRHLKCKHSHVLKYGNNSCEILQTMQLSENVRFPIGTWL